MESTSGFKRRTSRSWTKRPNYYDIVPCKTEKHWKNLVPNLYLQKRECQVMYQKFKKQWELIVKTTLSKLPYNCN